MKICIIYHSESGNTRHVAQHLASACDAHLVEISDRIPYMRLTRFLVLCKKARGEEKTEIEPAALEVPIMIFSSSDPQSGRLNRHRQSIRLSILSKDVKEKKLWPFQPMGANPVRPMRPSENGSNPVA
jgi:hypothetical protein